MFYFNGIKHTFTTIFLIHYVKGVNVMKEQIQLIKSQYQEFNNSSFELDETGQNNIVITVDNDTIFRFPRNEDNLKKLKMTYKTLNILDGLLNIKIPKISYTNFTDRYKQSFIGYKMIGGQVLDKEMIATLNLEEVGSRLSRFLKILHSREVYIQLKDDLVEHDSLLWWQDLYHRIEDKLFSFMSTKAKQEVEEDFKKILDSLSSADFKKCVIHGDFGPSNIIMDDKKVVGIIDFDSICIGDPAVDIASLIGPFGFSTELILHHFKQYENAKDYLERAILYTKSFALQEALYGVEYNDERAFAAGIKNYR